MVYGRYSINKNHFFISFLFVFWGHHSHGRFQEIVNSLASLLLIKFFIKLFSLITGPPSGNLNGVLNKLEKVNDTNGPFSAAFILGGAPIMDSDLSALFDVIKTDFISKTYFVII